MLSYFFAGPNSNKTRMKTNHEIIFGHSSEMVAIKDASIDLIVTSPPYPMIEMWDKTMSEQNPKIKKALIAMDSDSAFELMHQELDKVWDEVFRVTKKGAIVCINIGDATRTINGKFQLFPNHARIISSLLKNGFSNLPNILWRKQTNAPNKFMGSGMLPPSAYVTLEHEHILIFRKGDKRTFKTPEERLNRQQSSYFWEERNIWFSDLWDLKGTTQKLNSRNARERSAAYPFEIAYRLINMFSVRGDTILDPFTGTGTTTMAAIASCRNSIGYEIDPAFSGIISSTLNMDKVDEINSYIRNRILHHMNFMKQRAIEKGLEALKHMNDYYSFRVVTSQEKMIIINYLETIRKTGDNLFEATYVGEPIQDIFRQHDLFADRC